MGTPSATARVMPTNIRRIPSDRWALTICSPRHRVREHRGVAHRCRREEQQHEQVDRLPARGRASARPDPRGPAPTTARASDPTSMPGVSGPNPTKLNRVGTATNSTKMAPTRVTGSRRDAEQQHADDDRPTPRSRRPPGRRARRSPPTTTKRAARAGGVPRALSPGGRRLAHAPRPSAPTSRSTPAESRRSAGAAAPGRSRAPRGRCRGGRPPRPPIRTRRRSPDCSLHRGIGQLAPRRCAIRRRRRSGPRCRRARRRPGRRRRRRPAARAAASPPETSTTTIGASCTRLNYTSAPGAASARCSATLAGDSQHEHHGLGGGGELARSGEEQRVGGRRLRRAARGRAAPGSRWRRTAARTRPRSTPPRRPDSSKGSARYQRRISRPASIQKSTITSEVSRRAYERARRAHPAVMPLGDPPAPAGPRCFKQVNFARQRGSRP